MRFGSDGLAAPELSDDAHSATAATDVYSLGQLIGWAITGEMPTINVPLMPKSGPWRSVVREATHRDPTRRPATVEGTVIVLHDALGRRPNSPPWASVNFPGPAAPKTVGDNLRLPGRRSYVDCVVDPEPTFVIAEKGIVGAGDRLKTL